MKNFQNLIKNMNLPKSAGVYKFYDEKMNLLYVGKAKNLNSRIKQYANGTKNSYKTATLIYKTKTIKYDIVANEFEALILEKSIIGQLQPIYNIKLKDNQNYPYIKLEKLEKQQKLSISLAYKISTRDKLRGKNCFFYGPFLNKKSAAAIKKVLESLVLYEKGQKINFSNADKLTENFLICKKALLTRKSILYYEEKMEKAKENLQFELAQVYYDVILALKNSKVEQQNIDLNNNKNLDFLYFSAKTKNNLVISFTFYRNGIFLSQKNFIIDIVLNQDEVLVNFLNNYYKNHVYPDKLVVPEFWPKDVEFLDPKIKIETKINKKYQQILQNTAKNHHDFILQNFKKETKNKEKSKLLLDLVCKNLNLKNAEKIMAIDNSHIDNNYTTTGIIFYINGEFEANYSRYFNYRGEKKGDTDYMSQGFQKYLKIDKFIKPDLILVDGGKQQVNSVDKIMRENNWKIPIFGLIKNNFHKTALVIDVFGKKVHVDKEVFNFFSRIQDHVDFFAKSKVKKKQKINLLHS
ncbi:GIY-YIG nuclease family protein [Mycoplasma sp. 'Moose RK']|uniref:GIY-YIG nuclease family protein n=1 Tax=Mycoplasma sp. 'Moose RK' TaxID=2780095 RepID=UPI0018C2D295|nr:GIY-YIG nuclease family protein [Mycoplasma sp. 'Moose RK']MBG0730626.1 GIY-YIG nuclease family protein [Mycoplasma sp. 'Moose RK']